MSTPQAPPLAKYLASTDKAMRDKAIKNLSAFLSTASSDALPKSEMDKLWKGLFYCFWMSDKPLVQQALATELAGLALTITTTPASLRFLRGFWEATVREWNGIDRLRMDKYYMLVRRFVNVAFTLLMRADWERTAVEEYNIILGGQGGPLCPLDMRVPQGLAYHLADIYIEELEKALGAVLHTQSAPLPAPLALLLGPFFNLAAQTQSNTTYQRIQTSLTEPLIRSLDCANVPDPVGTDERQYPNICGNACLTNPQLEGKLDALHVRRGLLGELFRLASQPSTRDSNRRKLYALWKEVEDIDDE